MPLRNVAMERQNPFASESFGMPGLALNPRCRHFGVTPVVVKVSENPMPSKFLSLPALPDQRH
jgi:hypothetical protein